MTFIKPIPTLAWMKLLTLLLALSTIMSLQARAELALFDEARTLPPLPLINHRGEKMRLDEVNRPWNLVFLGYTQCPDVCPVHMAHLRQMMKTLEQQGADLPAVTFISVDPDRDTPEVLSAYVTQFDSRFVGATSAGSYMKSLQDALDAHVVVKKKHDHDHYQMMHQTRIYLFNDKGQWVGQFIPPFNGEQLAVWVSGLTTDSVRTAASH